MELAVGLLHLSDGAVQSAAAGRRGQDALAGRDVELILAGVVSVGLVVGDHADDAAVDVQASHDSSAGRQHLGLDHAELVALVVEQLLDDLVVDDGVGHVRGADQVGRAEALAGQHTSHHAEVGEDLRAGGVPLGRRRVGCGVAAFGVEADLHLVALVSVVGDVLHDAAVGQHGLSGHSLLAAGDKLAQLVGVLQDEGLLALLRSELRVEGLAEAALLQVVSGEGALGSHKRRSVSLHVVAVAQDGHAALARSDEGRQLFAAVSVLDQHVVSGENVARVVGREIAVTQEGRGRGELLHGHEQRVGLIEVKRHFVVLLLLVFDRVGE